MTYWDAGILKGEITDKFVLEVIKYHHEHNIPLTINLINDDQQYPAGAVMKRIHDMQRRGLVTIEDSIILEHP